MNEEDIRKYADLMKELELSGLEISEENRFVRLERSFSVSGKGTVSVPWVSSTDAFNASMLNDYLSVKSPFVGIFYAAPTENADPYVSIGDPVKKGQTLCIIEAMKMMNDITAEDDGIISEICVTDGQVVEFGTELFRIKR